jgi:hypothetical protein
MAGKYKWLVYSPSQMGGFCKYCVFQFSDSIAQKRPLITAPFQKLDKAIGKDGVFERHQNTHDHKMAVDAGINLIHSLEKPKETLPYMVSTQNREMYEKIPVCLKQL